MDVKLVQSTPNIVEFLASIASICYDSSPKNPMGLVNHLYKSGHHSVFEHVYFTWKVSGISRATSHQLVRHRMCSFTQRSQRYCDEDGFKFVTPPAAASFEYDNCMEEISKTYKSIQTFAPNEDARFVLPNACETELYISCNLRELIHIANERLCYRAQWEIRELVKRMCDEVTQKSGNEFLNTWLVPKCEVRELHMCPEASGCGKHMSFTEFQKIWNITQDIAEKKKESKRK